MSYKDGSPRRGFSLIELLVVIAIITLLISFVLPALREARRAARLAVCQSNMHQLGVAHHSYVNDYKDYIAAFNGEIKGNGSTAAVSFPTHSQLIYQAYLLALEGLNATPIALWKERAPGFSPVVMEQHSHLMLLRYTGGKLPSPASACPEDQSRLGWQKLASPVDMFVATVRPTKPDNTRNMQWWPYSSSYQLMPASWGRDYEIRGKPHPIRQGDGTSSQTTHDEYVWSGDVLAESVFGKKRLDQVCFPAQKVSVADSQARHFGKHDVYYAYPDARQPLLFFDSSVQVKRTGDANPGWEPKHSGPSAVTYAPDPAFESPVPAGRSDKVLGYYKWTRAGLRGVDFSGSEVRSVKR